MLETYRSILRTHGDELNEVNLATMLHRVASNTATARQEAWVLREYKELIHDILAMAQSLSHLSFPHPWS